MKYSDEILGKEKMWKLVLSMTIPCIFAQIVNLLYSIIDRIYIGNMVISSARCSILKKIT